MLTFVLTYSACFFTAVLDLRSFGVKAEVIDFETDTSVRARTRDSRGQAPASQENRRPPRTGDQDIPATQHQEQNNEPDRGHNQPSLLSYWSSPPGNGGHKLGTDEGSSRITGGNGVVSVHGNVVVDATTDVAPTAEPTPAVSCTVCEVVAQTARKRDADHGDRGGCHGGVVAQPVENGVEEDVVMCQKTSDNDNHDNDDDDDNDGDRDEGKDKNDNRNNDENQRGMDEKAPTPTPASGGPDTATHIARDEADACSDRSTRGPLRGLTGGRGNGHLEFPYGSASGRAAPVATGGRQQRGRGEGGRGGRGRGRGQALRASSSNSNTSNASAMMGTGCGQAVVEWAWDYFCTPWNVGGEEESLVGKSESSSAAAVGYSRGGKSCVSDESDTEQAHGRPTVPREVRSSIQDEKEEMTAYFLDFLCSGDSAGACDGGAGRGSTRDDEQVRDRPRRQDGGERSSAGISRRLPPPLYLQHDGHSRTVVGVLWPQGRSTAGLGGDAATSRGRRSGSGSGGREGARRCPGSLLVFDPSHAGSELRGALANEGNMRWCR